MDGDAVWLPGSQPGSRNLWLLPSVDRGMRHWVLRSIAVVGLTLACGHSHPHVQFDSFLFMPKPQTQPCSTLPGVGATTSWDDAAGRAYSLEMTEHATKQQVEQVRTCLQSAPLRNLKEKEVTYEVSHFERHAG